MKNKIFSAVMMIMFVFAACNTNSSKKTENECAKKEDACCVKKETSCCKADSTACDSIKIKETL